MTNIIRCRVLALSACVVAATSARAQQPVAAAPSAFVLLRGADTLMIERYSRSPTALDGTVLDRTAGVRFQYHADIAPDQTVTRLDLRAWMATSPDSAPPLQSGTITIRGDSAISEMHAGSSEGGGTQRLGTTRGAIPILNGSFAIVEQIVRRARAIGGDSVGVPTFAITGGITANTIVRRLGTDSASITVLGRTELRAQVNAEGDIGGGRIPSQGLMLARGSAARIAVVAAKPDYSAPAGAPYTAESVTVPTPGGFTLAGTLTKPKNASGKLPAVVTITGSGPEERDEALPGVNGYRPFRQIADTLSRRGIVVLRLDDRGTAESGGNFATATSVDFANDIKAAIAYLRARPDIDPSRIALLGHSEGGLIAPLVAADDPKLAGIVLLAGPSETGRQILRYQLAYGYDASPGLTPAKRDSMKARIESTLDSLGKTSPWLGYFMSHDPIATAKRVKVPVLILQGSTDRQVTAEQAPQLEAAFRAGGDRDVTLRVFPNKNHLFLDDPSGAPAGYAALPKHTIDPDVLGVIADWLAKRLRAH